MVQPHRTAGIEMSIKQVDGFLIYVSDNRTSVDMVFAEISFGITKKLVAKLCFSFQLMGIESVEVSSE